MAESTDSGEFLTYWLTRDVDAEDKLSEQIDVWLERPVRHNLPGGGAIWIGPGETGIEKRHAVWTVDIALANCRVYPATSRECIRVGED